MTSVLQAAYDEVALANSRLRTEVADWQASSEAYRLDAERLRLLLRRHHLRGAYWDSDLSIETRAALKDKPMTRELGYATRLAEALWEKHCKTEAPDWKPLPDLLGVLTQIDNMTTGLVRAAQAEERERCAQLCEAIAREAEDGEYYIALKCAEAIRALTTSTNSG